MGRTAGMAAITGALVAIAANTAVLLASPAVPDDRLSYPLSTGAFAAGQVVFALTQALMAFGILGLVRARPAGTGRAASAFGALAVAGMVLTVPGELVLIAVGDRATDSAAVSNASSLFGLGVLLADLGLIGLGLGMLRRRTWPMPWRTLPVALGAFQLLVVTPVSFALGFDSVGSYLVIAAADALTAAIGLALVRNGDAVPSRVRPVLADRAA